MASPSFSLSSSSLPLDAARRSIYRLVARTKLGRACARDRSARLATLAAVHIAGALVLAVVAPVWLLLAGPILLGVPHVVADVRYLVLRPMAGRGRPVVPYVLAPLAGLTALRALLVLGGPRHLEVEVAFGSAAVLLAVMLAPGVSWRRLATGAALAPLIALMLADGERAVLWLGHLHNLFAFGLWFALAWGEGPSRRLVGVAALFFGAALLLIGGAFDSIAGACGAWEATAAGLDLSLLREGLAPGMEPVAGNRVVVLFVFAQSVHYAVWLRLIPGRLARRAAAPTFRRSFEALKKDLGAVGFRVAIALSIAVPALALLDPVGVRSTYLSLALFHGWLEIATIALLFVSGRSILEAEGPAVA